MSAPGRAGRVRRTFAAVVALMAVAAGALALPGPPVHHSGSPPLGGLEGAGTLWERLGCVLCVGAIYAAAGGTALHLALNAWLTPEPYVACGWVCYRAVT